MKDIVDYLVASLRDACTRMQERGLDIFAQDNALRRYEISISERKLVDFQVAITNLRRDWLFHFDEQDLGDIELNAYAHALSQLEVTANELQAARNLAMVDKMCREVMEKNHG